MSTSLRIRSLLFALCCASIVGCSSRTTPTDGGGDTDAAPIDTTRIDSPAAESGADTPMPTDVGVDTQPNDVPIATDTGCAAGELLCGSACINVTNNPAHCGSCGNVCGGATPLCAGTTCVAGCATGQIMCGGGCIDPTSDPSNCGACGTVCGTGRRCTGGACVCNTGTPCNGTCVDTSSDLNNCGACGTRCASGQSCTGGTCSACPSGQQACGAAPGVCTTIATDVNNCGMCGRRCGLGQTCVSGTCTCPSGTTMCGTSCVNLSTDPRNCGSCGNDCGPAGTCGASGVCSCTGGPTVMRCSGLCVDTASDPLNCGSCGRAVCHANSCSGGSPRCVPGYTNCGFSTGCGTTCRNLQEDPENCGACGNRCASTQVCSAGACVTACPAGTATCGRSCVTDFSSDLFHCGGCAGTSGSGAVCGPGNFCELGVCQPYSAVGCTSCPCSRCPTTMPNCCGYPLATDAICTPAPTCPPTG